MDTCPELSNSTDSPRAMTKVKNAEELLESDRKYRFKG